MKPNTILMELFEGHATLRVVIEAVLEGRLGRAEVDDAERPRVARLDLGCYAVFGGDALAPAAAALVEGVQAPLELLAPDDQAWRDLFIQVHGAGLEDRPMRTFASHLLSRDRLDEFVRAVPGGFEVRPLDEELAAQLDDGLIPHGLQTFDSPAHLVAEGLGFGVLRAGRVVCAATSYARSASRVEVAISTRLDSRRLGLARVAGAALIGHCLDLGLAPEWSAANPVSKRLALSLGYAPARLCDIFYLPDPDTEGGRA